MSRPVLVLLAVATTALAASVVAPPARTTGYLLLRLGYDSNPFKYSAEDLLAFRRGEDPERFPIRSADDLQLAASLGLRRRHRLSGRRGETYFRAKLRGYTSNWEGSYGVFVAGAEQGFWPGGGLGLELTWMPNYLVRYYPDPRDDGYVACRFAEYLASVELRQELGGLSLAPFYRFELDDYHRPFDYYDTRAHRVGTSAAWAPSRSFEASASYEYKLARATGPVPDISYGQHGMEFRIAARPQGLPSFGFGAGYGVRLRDYTTDNDGTVDPSHALRRDQIEYLDLEAGYRLGGARLVASYRLEWREADSPYSAYIEDIKKYRRSRFSLGAVLGLSRLFRGGE